MPVTPLPSLDRTSATFRDDVDTFFATQLPNFSAEIDALEENVNAKEASAVSAAATATTKAAEADAAADAAASTANASMWSAATNYATGTSAISPTDYQTYRRKAPGGTTATDPASDSTNWEPVGVPATLSGKTLTAPKYTRDDDGTISGGTWAIDYNNGPVIKATAGANITSITMSNWPASGTEGHLRLRLVNFGAYTITFPAWNWVKSDLTTTTTFADLGLTLPSSGTAIVDLISDDGGTTIYATVLRG